MNPTVIIRFSGDSLFQSTYIPMYDVLEIV